MDRLRRELLALLDFQQAHVDLDSALSDLPTEHRLKRGADLPHSVWEVLEHMRIAQLDILNYTVDPTWQSPHWPDEYWPDPAVKVTDAVWSTTLDGLRTDLERARELARSGDNDLLTEIPHGHGGHTYLRELLLIAQHNSYHIGQIVAIRQALGSWPPKSA